MCCVSYLLLVTPSPVFFSDILFHCFVKSTSLCIVVCANERLTKYFTAINMQILVLLMLAGATFWASVESRSDTTMTILLSVSALYVVILDNIPQVGYLTSFDKWIFTMFIILAVCVFAHQAVVSSERKQSTWPLRQVHTRSIEMTGKVLLIPLSIYLYESTFHESEKTRSWTRIVVPIFFAGFGILCIREGRGVWKSMVEAVALIGDKIRDSKKTSKLELFLLNLVVFGKLSLRDDMYRAKLVRRARSSMEEEIELEQRKLEETKGPLQFRLRANRAGLVDSDDEEDEEAHRDGNDSGRKASVIQQQHTDEGVIAYSSDTKTL